MFDITEVKLYIEKYENAETQELIEEGVQTFLNNHVEWMQATDYR